MLACFKEQFEELNENEKKLTYKIIEEMLMDLNNPLLDDAQSDFPDYRNKLEKYFKNLIEKKFLENLSLEKVGDFIYIDKVNKIIEMRSNKIANSILDHCYEEFGLNSHSPEMIETKYKNNYSRFCFQHLKKLLKGSIPENEHLFVKLMSGLMVFEEDKDESYLILMNLFKKNKKNMSEHFYVCSLINFERYIRKYIGYDFVITKSGEEIFKTLENFINQDLKFNSYLAYSWLKSKTYKEIWYMNSDCNNIEVLDKYLHKSKIYNDLREIENGYALNRKEFDSLYLWYLGIPEIFENNSMITFTQNAYEFQITVKNNVLLNKNDCKTIFMKLIDDLTILPQKNIEEYSEEMLLFTQKLRENHLREITNNENIKEKRKRKV